MSKKPFKKLFEVSVDNPHQSFVALRDLPHNIRRKEILEEFWKQYEPFADKNFLSAFAQNPHSRFWEMYLACGLLNLNFQLLPARLRGETGPDLCLHNNENRIWIEAVAPTGGTGPDLLTNLPSNKVPARLFTINTFFVPEDKIVLRLCSGIIEKWRKLDNYLRTGIIKDNEPFVIALGTAALPEDIALTLPDPFLTDEIPSAVQAVYPVGNFQVTIDTKTMTVVSSHFERREAIKKQKGSEVPTNVFLCGKFSRVSGLIFSNSRISQINLHPENELSYVQNYLADQKLPQGWLQTGEEWSWEPEGRIKRMIIAQASNRPLAPCE
jgi:hypothetical protein